MLQRITAEDSGVQSVLCLDGTATALPISAGYHGFVRRGTGVIARDFGHDAFRVDVSSRVDQGSSWQLPVYLAHALSARDELGNGTPQPGDILLWATGEVDIDLRVRPVAGVAQKLARSLAALRSWRELGVDVRILLPTDNIGESAGLAESLAGVTGVTRLADVLPSLVAKVAASKTASHPAVRHPYWQTWPWLLAAALLLAVLGGISWTLLHSDLPSVDSEQEDQDLDDFGSRGKPLGRV